MIEKSQLKNRMAPAPEPTIVGRSSTEAALRILHLVSPLRVLRPPKDSCCGHCFGVGRDAVIRAIEESAGGA